MGYDLAYFRWRVLLLEKFGPAYFDTEGGAMMTWQVMQAQAASRLAVLPRGWEGGY